MCLRVLLPTDVLWSTELWCSLDWCDGLRVCMCLRVLLLTDVLGSTHFLKCSIVLWLSWKTSVQILNTCSFPDLKGNWFLPPRFHFLKDLLWNTEVLHLDEFQFIEYFFYKLCFRTLEFFEKPRITAFLVDVCMVYSLPVDLWFSLTYFVTKEGFTLIFLTHCPSIFLRTRLYFLTHTTCYFC